MTGQPRPWVVEAAYGPCPTCRGTGGHPTLHTHCPACAGAGLEFEAILDTTLRPIRYADENAAQIAAASWYGDLPVLYRTVRFDPCPDHSGSECPRCHGAGEVRHRPAEAPIFGDLLPPNEQAIP